MQAMLRSLQPGLSAMCGIACCGTALCPDLLDMQLKKAKTGSSAQKPKAAAAPVTVASAGNGILIDSDSDDGVPAQQATARFGGRRLGELLSSPALFS